MNSVETIKTNIPQFINLNNGYVIPDEAYENTKHFDLVQNGYDSFDIAKKIKENLTNIPPSP
jgi:hypothetical protein